MNGSRQYELIYIVSPNATEQEISDIHTEVEGIVGRFSGTIDNTENWGRRRLAYEIARYREGTYVLEVLTGSGEMVKEIERRLRVNDRVIRYLVVRVDEELRVVDRAQAKRKAQTVRRRQARGLPAEEAPAQAAPEAGGGESQEPAGPEGQQPEA